MKKNALLYVLLAVLLLANGFFLFKHFGDRPNHRDRVRDGKGSKNYIVSKLDFSDLQAQQYDSLKGAHREVMKTYEGDIRVLKEGFFGNISDENMSTTQIDSIATLISVKEKLKDIEVYNHIKQVLKICDDEQKKRFSSIIKDAINKRGRNGYNKRSRKNEQSSKRD